MMTEDAILLGFKMLVFPPKKKEFDPTHPKHVALLRVEYKKHRATREVSSSVPAGVSELVPKSREEIWSRHFVAGIFQPQNSLKKCQFMFTSKCRGKAIHHLGWVGFFMEWFKHLLPFRSSWWRDEKYAYHICIVSLSKMSNPCHRSWKWCKTLENCQYIINP